MPLRWAKPKDPDDVDFFELSWRKALKGDTISSSEWLLPSGIASSMTEIIDNGNRTRVWLQGGTNGKKYLLTNRITTVLGRQLDQTVELTVATN